METTKVVIEIVTNRQRPNSWEDDNQKANNFKNQEE